MVGDEHIVRFDLWCNTCKFEKEDPDDYKKPCGKCLANPVNLDSRRPVYYKKRKGEKKMALGLGVSYIGDDENGHHKFKIFRGRANVDFNIV